MSNTACMHHVVAVSPLGVNPVQISCPKCHQLVLSKVEYSAGLLTYLFCAGLFFCGYEALCTSKQLSTKVCVCVYTHIYY